MAGSGVERPRVGGECAGCATSAETCSSLLIALAALVAAPTAAADYADEQALAERHAPIVRIVEQTEECGHGEPFIPTDINLILDEPTVALRGPWNRTDLVKIAPSAKDLVDRFEYHLDFPGDPLDPGCDYAHWAKRLTAGSKPVVYAHVVTEPERPGKVSLQYWFFYPFNDFNNTHEGDWEMIQLVFDANDAAEALGRDPVEVGYSAHEGATRSDWQDDQLEVVDGTRPVVYPAAGSHANKYSAALWLGSSAEAGVGCDDTQGPHRELSPKVETIPSDRAAAEAAYPWIAFEGRWGELQKAFFNGPTGPNLKTQWTQPITWSDGWSDRSYAIPAGGAFGTNTTDFFCAAVERGSRALVHLLRNPLPDPPRARGDPRARDLRRRTRDLDAGRADSHRPTPLVGPDHLGLRAYVRQTAGPLPRARRPADPDRGRDHIHAMAPSASRRPHRHGHG